MSESFLAFCNHYPDWVLLVTVMAYVPSWRELYRTRSSQNVSLKLWAFWGVWSLSSFGFAICRQMSSGSADILIATSLVNCALLVATLILILRWRELPQRHAFRVRIDFSDLRQRFR